MTEAHAARVLTVDEGAELERRGVPSTWPVAWAAICLAAFVAGWWFLVPRNPIGELTLGPLDSTAGLGNSDLERIHDYAMWSMPLWLATIVLPVGTLLLFGLTPTGARLTARIGSGLNLQSLRALCIAFAVVGIAWAVTLPVQAAAEVVSQHMAEFVGGWSSWAVGRIVELVKWWAVAGVAVLLVRAAARLVRRSWWVFLTLGVFVLVMAGSFAFGGLTTAADAYPSLPDGPLRSQILGLADEIGVDVADVRVVPESPSAGRYNAYVTGVGTDHVVVIHETLLRRSTPAETRLVAAHEVGHIATDDSFRRSVLAGLAAALTTAVVGAAATSSRIRRRADTQRVRISDAPAVPMLIALAVAVGVFVVPAMDAASRAFEAQADLTALQATGDPVALRGVVSRTAQLNFQEPHGPWIWRVLASHPSAAERMALADAWAARNT